MDQLSWEAKKLLLSKLQTGNRRSNYYWLDVNVVVFLFLCFVDSQYPIFFFVPSEWILTGKEFTFIVVIWLLLQWGKNIKEKRTMVLHNTIIQVYIPRCKNLWLLSFSTFVVLHDLSLCCFSTFCFHCLRHSWVWQVFNYFLPLSLVISVTFLMLFDNLLGYRWQSSCEEPLFYFTFTSERYERSYRTGSKCAPIKKHLQNLHIVERQ